MCGIYGSTKYYRDEIISSKLECIKHRGPDASKFVRFKNNEVCFGQVRLSIIDLDERANQPFKYHHISITYNGEIYNFKELKNELIKKGYSFSTTTDTEVICALYMDLGKDFVKELNGMFAFVIYDEIENILFGARDRMGQKPMCYSIQNGYFEFSSQVSPIVLSNKHKINRDGVMKYLEWGYVPEPYSIFENIFKLKAGHSFTYDLMNKKIKTKQFWELPNTINESLDYAESVSKLDKLIDDSVKRRLVSDVPLGVFLSGGVDSSLIAAMAQKNSIDKVKTFSVGFEEAGFDETKYADMVGKHLGTDHTKVILSVKEGIDLIDDFVNYFDEPFFDTSALGQMILSRETKKHVTVALSGDGGDELFLGYQRYSEMLNKQWVYSVPQFVRKIGGFGFSLNSSSRRSLLNGKALQLGSIEDYYLASMQHVDRDWLNYEKSSSVEYIELLFSNKPLIERLSDFEIKTYMNGDIHTKVDRASMKYSLETRSPFMDHNIVEFSREIPTAFKYKDGIGKRILKDVLYSYVPKEYFDRKKAGFAVPVGNWFRNELKDYVYQTCSLENLAMIPEINNEVFLALLEEHMDGKWNHTPKIWSVIMLINWMKKNNTNY